MNSLLRPRIKRTVSIDGDSVLPTNKLFFDLDTIPTRRSVFDDPHLRPSLTEKGF